MKEMAKPAGINLSLKGSSSDVYYSKYWLQTKMKVAQWIHRENILGVLKQGYKTGSSWNSGHYNNPNLDKQIEKASTTVKPEVRQKHFTKIQEIMREEGPAVIPFHQGIYGATRKNIKGYREVRNGSHELRFVKLT